MAVAAITLKSTQRFPVGTSVAAYPRSAWTGTSTDNPSGAPSGSPAETATVAADGTLAFTTLTAGTRYFAYALVGGEHRIVAFVPQSAVSAGGSFSPTTWDGTKAYSANDLVKYAAGLYRAKADKGPPAAPALGTTQGGLAAIAQVGPGAPYSGVVDRATDPTLPQVTLKGDVLQVKVLTTGTFTIALSGAWTSGTANRGWHLRDSAGTIVFGAGAQNAGFDANGGVVTATATGTYFLCLGIFSDDTSRAYTATITNGTGTVEGVPSNATPAADSATWELVVQGV